MTTKKEAQEIAMEIAGIEKEEIKELKEGLDINKKNPYKELFYSTSHLPLFKEFSSLIGLHGKQYLPILKARYYQLIGGIMQKPFSVGKQKTDTRLHVAYPLVTEAGKNEIIYSIKSLIRENIDKGDGKTFTLAQPTSMHPEQLIGKFIEVKEKIKNEETNKWKTETRRKENRGHLNNDFLEFDECTKLITSNSPEDSQAREHLSIAENTIGRNEVEKRLTEDLPENVVRYFPKCTNSYYFQPFKKIPEEAFLQGFLRRKIIPVGKVSAFLNLPNSEIYSSKLSNSEISEEKCKEILIKHIENIRQLSNKCDFVFSQEAIEIIQEYALNISSQGQIHSPKIRNFCKVSKYTCLSNLMKMSVIIAASYYKQVVDVNCVALAYMDLVELMQNTYDFIYERTKGDFDYGTTWGGADFKQKKCLRFLYNRQALSRENSNISIEDFVNLCVEIFEVGERQAREKYLNIKKLGLIDSCQEGQHSSKVWLKIQPEEHKDYLQGSEGCKGYTAYKLVFDTLNAILTPLQSSQPRQPLEPIKPEMAFK